MSTFESVVVEAAWPLVTGLSALLAALILFVVARRARGNLKSVCNEETRTLCHELIGGLITATIEYPDALVQLRKRPAAQVRAALKAILTTDKNLPPARAAVLKAVCEDLGLVAQWRRTLADTRNSGRKVNPFSFVLRAEAAENLGIIHHQPSWPLLVEALDDPNGAVRFAAARSLASIREPESFTALADRLEAAAQDSTPTISVRSLKMALASFPISQAVALRRLLEHSHPRVRFLASDVVALMVQRESSESHSSGCDSSRLAPQLADIFLTRLAEDEDSDVRARAASIVARLEPARAMPVLAALLGDPAWFVRLHAVRALRHQRFAPLSLASQRLTDPNWRVREAAAQTLVAGGRSGLQKLFEHFLETCDRYSQEQVIEEVERAGLLLPILAAYGEPGRKLETHFVEEMVARGFGDVLLPVLQNVPPEKLRALARELTHTPNAHVELFVRQWGGPAPVEQTWPVNESQPVESATAEVS
ncbi:MAG TPA: HEAT repeat domain-containing protein [Terriglobia bacterium]|nr:HEAT repeat domain-containing protein [Terriglobia bacterium]